MTQLKSDHVKVHNVLSTDGAQASYMFGPHSLSCNSKYKNFGKFLGLLFISSLKVRTVSFKHPINPPWQELKNFHIYIIPMRQWEVAAQRNMK